MVLALVAICSGSFCQGVTAVGIMDGAKNRIREHRMGELVVTVVDADGDPIDGATVEVRQTRHEFLFGSNIFAWQQPTDEDTAKYRDQYAAIFNFATLAFYWSGYEGTQGSPQHDDRELVAAWCKEHDITTKGHPLVWNHSAGVPKWLPEDLDEIKRLSDARVTDCITRFLGTNSIWDVVNEAADPFRAGDAFENRMSEMMKRFGKMPVTIDSFKLARAASPDATLLINDYNLGPKYHEVIEQLVDDDGERMYDVIGIQSHMHGGAWPTERAWDTCEQYAEYGVPLHFTETTICSGPRSDDGWETTDEGEALQADEVERFYTILYSHPAVEAITWWDFADRNAWQGAPAGFLRKDLSPKPAYERLLGLIKGEWWTDETGEAAGGELSVHATYGDYEITARAGDRTKTVEFHHPKGGDGAVTVALP